MRTKLLHISVLGVAIGMVACTTEDPTTVLTPGGNTTGGVVGSSSTGGSGSVQNTTSHATSSPAGGSVATGNGGTSSGNTGNTGATTGGTKSNPEGGSGNTGVTTGGTKATSAGGSGNTGNTATTGGTKAAGGTSSGNTGNTVSTGGTKASTASGGSGNTGNTATGGARTSIAPTGGAATGGAATGGTKATGGGAGTSTTSTSTTPTSGLDCTAIPAMPTGGTLHSGNGQGGKDNLAWQIWSNGGSGSLTTFSTPAFIASWNNSGDYLGRLGFEWGNAGKAFTAYGDITADLAFKKNGTGGQYSYVGIYGWSTNPCIEWYIVDDSYSAMPFNTGTAPSGTADLDGGTYNLVKRHTTGTGGDRCGGAGSWDQFYSIRTKGRQCGTISVSEHFKIWDAKGWKLGNLLEVKILVEAASGVGSVDFSVADVKKTL